MFIVQKHYSRKYSAIFSWVSLGEGAPATPQRKPIISATGLQNIFEIVEELGERGILKISLLYNHNHKRVQSERTNISYRTQVSLGSGLWVRCLSLCTRALVETLLM